MQIKRKGWILAFFLVFLLLFVFAGVLPRLRTRQELQAAVERERSRVVRVNVVTATRRSDSTGLTLPGQVMPFRETALYARTQGFLKRRLVDIGSPVRPGQLLATIDAPELDQEIMRAQTDLKLAKVNLDRVESVDLPGAVSQQDIDNRQAGFEASRAGLRRLQVLKSLQEIRAPFRGVITARTTEVGALITTSGASPLFTLAQLDTLRVLVDVPQAYYRSIRVGQPVEVRIPEWQGRSFSGTVIRTSEALRTQTRTLLTEVIIPNPKRELVSGLYGQVNFQLEQTDPPVMIPANTLLLTPEGPRVVVVGAGGQLRYQPVELGRDLGTSLEAVSGLRGNENLVINPSDNLREGQRVQPVTASAPR
jgi:RND family efflux transporter MFP subunit